MTQTHSTRFPCARMRIHRLADGGSFQEADRSLIPRDFLGFEGYEDKLREGRLRSHENEAVVTGYARIGGYPCMLGVMEPNFMMGTLGVVVGEKLTRMFETARRRRLPALTLSASGGARMQEGALALYQMAKTVSAVRAHAARGLFYLSVICDPTLGGVTASFASLGDIILAEPGALIGFAGPRVIQQTIGETLPEGFQRAEFQMEHGFVDAVVPRKDLRDTLIRLLKLHGKGERHG